MLTFRSDPHLAQHNILSGLEAVLEQQQRIAQELPFVEIDRLRELVPLTHAVVFAAAQVNRAPEATTLRDLMPLCFSRAPDGVGAGTRRALRTTLLRSLPRERVRAPVAGSA